MPFQALPNDSRCKNKHNYTLCKWIFPNRDREKPNHRDDGCTTQLLFLLDVWQEIGDDTQQR